MTETDLCNDALAQLGHSPIVSIDDETTPANVCKTMLPILRDAALVEHHWNFNTKHATLALDDPIVASDYSYSYTLPADCLKLILLNADPSLQWDVEAGHLVTDEPTATIKYLARITDPTKWHPMFAEALGTGLASKCAGPIANNFKAASGLFELYRSKLELAKAVDGQEGGQKVFTSTALTDDVR